MGVCSVGFESSHIMAPYSDESFTSIHACGGYRGMLQIAGCYRGMDGGLAIGVPPGPPVLEASGGAVLLKKIRGWQGSVG